MDFVLSEEQSLLKNSVGRFIEKEYDFLQRRALVAGGGSFSAAHWRTFADMGWLAIGVPEEFGGLGGGAIELALVMEEFGKGLVLEPFLPVAVLATRVIVASGDRTKQQALLPAIAAGDSRPVLAHGEAGAGGHIAWVETRAQSVGNGCWRLDGRKSLVLGGPFADQYLVSARTAGAAGDIQGISLFLVPAAADGLLATTVKLNDSSLAAELVFDGLELGPEAVIGEVGGAHAALAEAHAHATVALCAEAVGAMEMAFSTSRDYLKTRQQFGVPIGSFQALQHRLADMLIELELSRVMVLRALSRLDADPSERNHAVAATKAHIGKSGKFVGAQAIQLHGGMGMTEEYLVGHYFRRLVMMESLFGTSAFHLARMAASWH